MHIGILVVEKDSMVFSGTVEVFCIAILLFTALRLVIVLPLFQPYVTCPCSSNLTCRYCICDI